MVDYAKLYHYPRLRLERLEDRLAPALRLTYDGPGTALTLSEVGAAAVDNVTITESPPGTMVIDLGGATFEPGSTAAATGLVYQNPGSLGTSGFATINAAAVNAITTL